MGRKYGNTKMELDASTVKKLPVVTFVFEENVSVHVQPAAYMEKAGGKYVPRIYLTEGSGAVLGGNFMQDHDVLFDAGACPRAQFGQAFVHSAHVPPATSRLDPAASRDARVAHATWQGYEKTRGHT